MSDGTPEEEPECPVCEGTGVFDDNAGTDLQEFGEEWTLCNHGEDTEETQGS
jgi:hypothetical protein